MCLSVCAITAGCTERRQSFDLIVRDGTIYDGTGALRVGRQARDHHVGRGQRRGAVRQFGAPAIHLAGQLRVAHAQGWQDAQIVETLDTNLTMVMRVREKLATEGLDAVLTRKKRETPPVPAIFDGEAQAKLTALACSKPPEGHARWTIRLLAEHVVERRIVPAAHFNTVGRALKKTTSSRT